VRRHTDGESGKPARSQRCRGAARLSETQTIQPQVSGRCRRRSRLSRTVSQFHCQSISPSDADNVFHLILKCFSFSYAILVTVHQSPSIVSPEAGRICTGFSLPRDPFCTSTWFPCVSPDLHYAPLLCLHVPVTYYVSWNSMAHVVHSTRSRIGMHALSHSFSPFCTPGLFSLFFSFFLSFPSKCRGFRYSEHPFRSAAMIFLTSLSPRRLIFALQFPLWSIFYHLILRTFSIM